MSERILPTKERHFLPLSDTIFASDVIGHEAAPYLENWGWLFSEECVIERLDRPPAYFSRIQWMLQIFGTNYPALGQIINSDRSHFLQEKDRGITQATGAIPEGVRI